MALVGRFPLKTLSLEGSVCMEGFVWQALFGRLPLVRSKLPLISFLSLGRYPRTNPLVKLTTSEWVMTIHLKIYGQVLGVSP